MPRVDTFDGSIVVVVVVRRVRADVSSPALVLVQELVVHEHARVSEEELVHRPQVQVRFGTEVAHAHVVVAEHGYTGYTVVVVAGDVGMVVEERHSVDDVVAVVRSVGVGGDVGEEVVVASGAGGIAAVAAARAAVASDRVRRSEDSSCLLEFCSCTVPSLNTALLPAQGRSSRTKPYVSTSQVELMCKGKFPTTRLTVSYVNAS